MDNENFILKDYFRYIKKHSIFFFSPVLMIRREKPKDTGFKNQIYFTPGRPVLPSAANQETSCKTLKQPLYYPPQALDCTTLPWTALQRTLHYTATSFLLCAIGYIENFKLQVPNSKTCSFQYIYSKTAFLWNQKT